MFAPEMPGGAGGFPPSVSCSGALPPLPPYYPALLPPVPFKPPFLPLTPSMAPLNLHLSHNSAFKPNLAVLSRPYPDAVAFRPSPSPPTDTKPPITERLEFPQPCGERLDLKHPLADRLGLKPPIIERQPVRAPTVDQRQPISALGEGTRAANQRSAFSPLLRRPVSSPTLSVVGEAEVTSSSAHHHHAITTATTTITIHNNNNNDGESVNKNNITIFPSILFTNNNGK